jgi:hypothetical protein
MTLASKSKLYLSAICGLSNLTALSETSEQITFKVKQSDFINAFREMEAKYGQFNAYPVDTSVSQIDAVWKVGDNQHVIFVTELTDNMPEFYVTLLNASYTPGKAATQLEKAKNGFEELKQTPEWQNIGHNMVTVMSDARAIEAAAKRLGLL